MAIKFNSAYAKQFIRENDIKGLETQVSAAHGLVNDKTGLGNDFLGWVDLPVNYDKEEFARIKAAAAKIRKDTDILIVIGIGGSYLGARAAIEFLKGPFYNQLKGEGPEIYFAGNSISGAYLSDIVKLCEGKRVSVNIISKSGTTTEPAVAFRVLRDLLEKQYKEGEVTLAHILVNTQAGKPDYPKAISLLENASEDLENDSAVDAQMLLGLIYANGVGIKADDDKATWYFKRSSAISRTGYSEYWAGMMFLNGEEGFIEKNKQKALHWLNLSCMEGFDTGCEEFEKLTNG